LESNLEAWTRINENNTSGEATLKEISANKEFESNSALKGI